MANYKNKIIYGGEVLIDLTADTVTKDKVLSGYTFHDMSGKPDTGTCAYDSDTSDATILVAEMLEGKTAYARGAKLEGTMPNRGAISETISELDDSITISQGYHDGSGTVSIAATEQEKLKPENIREGVTILGVEGTMSGSEEESAQADKTATPSSTTQIILPDEGYTCLRQVTVNPIPYSEEENAAGGLTVTIGS